MIDQPIIRPYLYQPPRTGANIMIAQVIQPPMRRMISIRAHGLKGKDGQYFLSFPRLVFGFKYATIENDTGVSLIQMYIGFLKENDSRVFIPTLLNVYVESGAYGKICLGELRLSSSYNSVQEMASTNINSFWSSYFNYSLFQFIMSYRPEVKRDFHKPDAYQPLCEAVRQYFIEWQAKTKADPTWVPDDFIPIENPTQELILES